jgi:RimJ/RimL family protein N-acetyltransferase
MPLIIARAEISDASRIAEIQIECWRRNLSHWAPVSFVERFNTAQQAEKYAARIADPAAIVLVSKQDDQITGVIGAKPNQLGQASYDQYIFGLYVDPAVQRRGIASLLLTKLLDVLKENEAGNAIIFTFAANEPARKLYEKCGGVLLPYTDNAALDLKIPHVSYGLSLK